MGTVTTWGRFDILPNNPGAGRRIAVNNQTTGQPVDILLVEDNPGDVRLVVESLRDSKVHNKLHVAKDGMEAIALLRREGKYADAPHPDLILLDWNMPKKDGPEVLAEIKEDPKLKHIPVVILTSSNAREDIIKAYNLHANCYVIKPIDLEQFIMLIRSIVDFWFTTVKLPAGRR